MVTGEALDNRMDFEPEDREGMVDLGNLGGLCVAYVSGGGGGVGGFKGLSWRWETGGEKYTCQ